MPATEPLWKWMGVDTSNLTKREIYLLEADLFAQVCKELIALFKSQYKDYFHLMKFTADMENDMLKANLGQEIVNSIVSTKKYTIKGIAYYTNSFEEVIDDLSKGLNTNPSSLLLLKLIDLDRSVRHEVYETIKHKIAKHTQPSA